MSKEKLLTEDMRHVFLL